VDDVIVATNDDKCYQKFMDELGTSFELSASGKLTRFLGCKVEQDLVKGTVRMSQEKYCNDVLKQFKMSDANAVHTPCEANQHLQASNSHQWSTETQMWYVTTSRLWGHACFSQCSHVAIVHLQ